MTEFQRKLSSRLIGIPAGFLEQAHGNCVRYYFATVAPLGHELRSRGAEIRSRGVEVLGKIVDSDVVDRLCSVFQQRVATGHPSVEVIKADGHLISETICFEDGDPALPIVQEVMTGNVVDALRATLSTNFSVVSYIMWRNHSLQEGQTDIYSDRWHVDGARTDEYKLFVFMHDVTPDHGGTVIATRDETRQALRAGYITRKNYAGAANVFSDLECKSCMVGPKGHAYIFTPNLCLHRAGVPKRGLTRTVLMVRVLPSRDLDLEPRTRQKMSRVSRAVKKITTYLGHNDP
jgi:hypothetical protein